MKTFTSMVKNEEVVDKVVDLVEAKKTSYIVANPDNGQKLEYIGEFATFDEANKAVSFNLKNSNSILASVKEAETLLKELQKAIKDAK